MKSLKEYITEKKVEKISPSRFIDEKDRFLSIDGMEENVSEWYHKEYEDDEQWDKDIDIDMTFKEMIENLIDIYENGDEDEDGNEKNFGIDDSIIRERVFQYVVDLMNIDYDCIYKLWEGK